MNCHNEEIKNFEAIYQFCKKIVDCQIQGDCREKGISIF